MDRYVNTCSMYMSSHMPTAEHFSPYHFPHVFAFNVLHFIEL